MSIDELRVIALQIGHVDDEYEAEIEDYNQDAGVAVFAWKKKESEELGIWIELANDGSLLNLSRDVWSTKKGFSNFSEEQLKKRALEFVNHHYPYAENQFTLEKWNQLEEGTYRLSYVSMALELPLPFSGFFLTIAKSGEITEFRYYGEAINIQYPEMLVEKEVIKEKFLTELNMDLQITEISSELYVDGDSQLHLVYEPSLPFYSYPADGHRDEYSDDEEDERSESLECIFRPKENQEQLNDLIGFDEQSFEKIREVDLGNVTGSVWRTKAGSSELQDDLTIDGFFHRRNDYTLKLMHDNESGNLHSMYSFLNRKGNLLLDYLECKELALQMLFHLYPLANQIFRLVVAKEGNEEGSNHFHYEFRVFHKEIPIRVGAAMISVNRTTGKIDHYMSPGLDPELLVSVNTQPAITEVETKEIYQRAFTIKLEWTQEYLENHESHYTLTYVPSFPLLEGEIAFIEAQTGQKILKKI
ncbi:YcdB/YcdC domain-containing protein [Metabacillus rhizolycopersici]|uniref:DUF4901 domain-containing protein n=1 Tax=Metabacillus rhizolycopersici TaxID=2875709 RepID=A0ABS7URM4_9BACI|nr:YcdB/YcdC domain-containing protein [Metabacillus rhizolycopersici]MBZ5750648.1 DUF4901 domain-containing protein [Metabacillus rhizolycopersici]